MKNIIDETRKTLSDRLVELEPLLREYEQIKHTLEALEATVSSDNGRSAPRAAARGRGRGATSTPVASSGTRRRRGRGGGETRADRVLAVLSKSSQPMSIPEVAAELQMETYTQLYPVAKSLAADGLVVKDEETSRWSATAAGSAPSGENPSDSPKSASRASSRKGKTATKTDGSGKKRTADKSAQQAGDTPAPTTDAEPASTPSVEEPVAVADASEGNGGEGTLAQSSGVGTGMVGGGLLSRTEEPGARHGDSAADSGNA